MGQKDAVDLLERKPHDAERFGGLWPGVDDIGAAAGDHHRASLGAIGIGQRGRRSAQDDAQRLAVKQVGIAGRTEHLAGLPLDH